jgi:hypothetical protein
MAGPPDSHHLAFAIIVKPERAPHDLLDAQVSGSFAALSGVLGHQRPTHQGSGTFAPDTTGLQIMRLIWISG